MENNIMNFMIDVLTDRLDDFESNLIYGADMGYSLLDYENSNGTYTFNAQEALEWINKYFSDICEVVADIEFNMGAESVPNPFLEPEKFMVICMLEVANRLCSNCAYIDENWNNEIELMTENIQIIKEQLEAQRNSTFVA